MTVQRHWEMFFDTNTEAERTAPISKHSPSCQVPDPSHGILTWTWWRTSWIVQSCPFKITIVAHRLAITTTWYTPSDFWFWSGWRRSPVARKYFLPGPLKLWQWLICHVHDPANAISPEEHPCCGSQKHDPMGRWLTVNYRQSPGTIHHRLLRG